MLWALAQHGIPALIITMKSRRKKMIESVTNMVMNLRMSHMCYSGCLGNENVYGYACNANTEPDAFFKFANEVALADQSN